jgi:hypothetical protein
MVGKFSKNAVFSFFKKYIFRLHTKFGAEINAKNLRKKG